MLLRSALALALVVGATSLSAADSGRRGKYERSYTRAQPMTSRAEWRDAAPHPVKPFTIEEKLLFERANGSRW